jgi:hypothetical protein
MHARGVSPGAILAALLHENQTRCDPVRPEENIRKLVEDITSRYQPGDVPAAHIIMIAQKQAEAAERGRQRLAGATDHARRAFAQLRQGEK